jgi:hypothetical protein
MRECAEEKYSQMRIMNRLTMLVGSNDCQELRALAGLKKQVGAHYISNGVPSMCSLYILLYAEYFYPL